MRKGPSNRLESAQDIPVTIITPHMTAEEAFASLAKGCLRHVLVNLTATLKGDAEALHHMRVAVRRLRAVISAFAEMTSDRRSQTIKSELKWLMGYLGEARDLDVLLNETWKHFDCGGGRKERLAIERSFHARRKRAYQKVRAVLRTSRFRTLVFETLAWVDCGPWRRKRDALAVARRRQAIVAYAAEELQRRHKKLAKDLVDFARRAAQAPHPGEEAALCGGILW